MNLMGGRVVPPTPTDGGDGFYPQPQGRHHDREKEEREQRIKRTMQDEDDFIMILSQWIVNNN